jgi:hypothetical protein
LPWLSTRPRGRHCRQWGCTCPSMFFATGSFMWLSLSAAHSGASECWSGVATRQLWMGPLLAFTPVMWSIARCCSDSSYGYGVLWGLLWTPSFFLGLGFWFRPKGWVGLDSLRLSVCMFVCKTWSPQQHDSYYHYFLGQLIVVNNFLKKPWVWQWARGAQPTHAGPLSVPCSTEPQPWI